MNEFDVVLGRTAAQQQGIIKLSSLTQKPTCSTVIPLQSHNISSALPVKDIPTENLIQYYVALDSRYQRKQEFQRQPHFSLLDSQQKTKFLQSIQDDGKRLGDYAGEIDSRIKQMNVRLELEKKLLDILHTSQSIVGISSNDSELIQVLQQSATTTPQIIEKLKQTIKNHLP